MASFTLKQQEAFNLINEGHNLFLGGPAGTGKSFLLCEVVKALRLSGKCVHLTCTTGIACTNFPPELGAMTVHRWSGIQDGRYRAHEVMSLIRSHTKFQDALHRIKHTDTLIIDEVSMLSERLFSLLAEVCTIKDSSKQFGGMQLILCGDFVQLPPVPNTLYNDDGKYCFESPLFEQLLCHKIYLDQIVRQNDQQLIRSICEVSWGEVSDDTETYIKTLQRPLLPADQQSTKLFATNYLVDNYNRKCVVEARGVIGEYLAEDTGENRHLCRLMAPKILWLKVGSPVILLRNISNILFNGLRGTVLAVEQDGPVVNFPAANKTLKIPKMTFTVFSPQQQCNLAERVQVPLKLAYAISVHKSQGMTLDSVEVDCQQMFKPGQLGVAMGRVKNAAGLRVINFTKQACLPQPDAINMFMSKQSIEKQDNLICCKIERLDETAQQIFSIDDMTWIEAEYDPCSDIQQCVSGPVEEEEFDEEFDKVLSSTAFSDAPELVDFTIPSKFHLVGVLDSLKNENPSTSLMKEVNDLVSSLLKNNLQAAEEFAKKEFLAISSILETLNITEPVAVKTEHLSDFYRKCHLHQTSDTYKLNTIIMFQDMPHYESARGFICFNITTEIRKFLLKEKIDLFPLEDQTASSTSRHITSGCCARVRYVAGYCVSKVRYQYMKKQNSTCFQTSVAAQQEYEESCYIVKCLDSLTENENYLEKHSNLPETLIDVVRKQNISRGLTHIPDELYTFFIHLCERCLSLLTDSNLHKFGDQLHGHCFGVLKENQALHEEFVNIVTQRTKFDHFSVCIEDSLQTVVENVLNETVLRAHAIGLIYLEILKKFLMIMINQFRKDLLQALSVQKTMAHRKQIQVRKKKVSAGQTSVTFESIVRDQTDQKVMSHNLIKGLLLSKSDFLHAFKKPELLTLAKAYGIKIGSKHTKGVLIKSITTAVTEMDRMKNITVFTTTKTAPGLHEEPQSGSSGIPEEQLRELQPSRSRAQEEQLNEPQPSPSRAHEEQLNEPQSSPSRAQEEQLNEPQPGPSRAHKEQLDEPQPGPSRAHEEQLNEPQRRQSRSGSSQSVVEYLTSDSDEEEKCKVCNKSTGSVNWIQCENCGLWLHRKCAGLQQKKKWNKLSRKSVKFFCKDCK